MTDLRLGDCLEVLRTMPDSSVDAVVTDPPYGLSFMGKRWDYDVPSVEIWAECLRVLKPGGHLLAFAGTRTQHRMAVRIEDAGFEIRDMIAWVYGSGFPKSLDVSKAIDKAAGAEREVVGVNANSRPAKRKGGAGFDAAVGGEALGDMPITAPATPEAQQWAGWGTALKPSLEPITMARKPLEGTVAANVLAHGTGGLNVDACRIRPAIASEGREWEEQRNRVFLSAAIAALSDKLTELASSPCTAGEDAEPRQSARGAPTPPATCKPATGCCDGTKAGSTSTSSSTAGFGRMPTVQSLTDIASIIETTSRPTIDWKTWNSCQSLSTSAITSESISAALKSLRFAASSSSSAGIAGRWPSNLIHDGSDEVVALFPQTGAGAWPKGEIKREGVGNVPFGSNSHNEKRVETQPGSAARFFYTAKCSKSDRESSDHPTMKPTDLMRYLCRLVTPPGGVVLDPFMGSGSTGKAAMLEGFEFIGIERDPAYHAIAQQRITRASAAGYQPSLLVV